MSAREEVLTRIREALGRRQGQAASAPPEPLLRTPGRTVTEKILLFRKALEGLAGTVHEARSVDDAREYVNSVVGGRLAIASNHPYLQACGIGQVEGVRSSITDAKELRNVCTEAFVGITSAYCLLAETGTVVLRATPEEPRMISLLPPLHIAVVPVDRLVANLDEMLGLLPKPVDTSSAMTLITGPSRTGDIEQILVRGVHGPGSVHVVIVRGKETRS